MFDIYLLEAIINGLLLGGVLALLALGLNLIFGVIDVVWICYAELVMLGMYTIFYCYVKFGFPLILACVAGIAVVAVLGFLVHFLVISPILGTAPINQLLATGGLLFFLQSFATLIFPSAGVLHRGHRNDRLVPVPCADLYGSRYSGHFTGSGSDGADGGEQPQGLPVHIRYRRRACRARRMPAGAAV